MGAGVLQTAAAAVLGVAAGCCYAVGTIVQQRVVQSLPFDDALRPRLVTALVRRRSWLTGIGISTFSFGLQAVALALGPIALVEPLILTDLLVALPLRARSLGIRPGHAEYTAAVLVAAGLATFLVAARPRSGVVDPQLSAWVVSGTAVVVAVVAFLLAAPRAVSVARTSLLAAAAGASLGLVAALTKAVTNLLANDGISVVTRWQPWTLAGVATASLLLSQSALQAGPLAISLPLIDVLDPLVGVAIGVTTFGERLATTPTALTLEAVGVVAVVTGVIRLDRSPRIRSAQLSLQASQPLCRNQPASPG